MSDVVELGQGAAAAQGDENALVPSGGAGSMMGGGGYDGGYGMSGMGGRCVTKPQIQHPQLQTPILKPQTLSSEP